MNNFILHLVFAFHLFDLALLLQPPPFRISGQPLGHIAGTSPPSPTLLRCAPSFLSREEFSFCFPRRLASNRAYPRGYVGAICWSIFVQENPLVGVRTHAMDLSIHEVKPVVHRGDGSKMKTQRSLHFIPEWFLRGGGGLSLKNTPAPTR